MTLYLRPLLDEGAISSWSPSFRVLWNHPIWAYCDVPEALRIHNTHSFLCHTCTSCSSRVDIDPVTDQVIMPYRPEWVVTATIHTFEWMGPIAYNRQSIYAGACKTCNTVMWGANNATLSWYAAWQLATIAEQQANTTRLYTGQDSEPG